MKANKHLHLLTLLLFLFQVTFPPALLSQTSTPQNPTAPAAVHSVDDLFAASVSGRERHLLFEFVQYVISSFPPREGLRTASEELHKSLNNDQFWFSLNIGDPEMADLLTEANAGRRYLLEDSAPVEVRLHAEQRRIEKLLITDHEQIASNGVIPDGLLERTRELASLYDLQDDLWKIKIAMLYKITMLSSNIIRNYLSEHPDKYVHFQDKIARSTAATEALLNFGAGHAQEINALKERFQDAQDAYSVATGSALSDERTKTVDLTDVIQRQSEMLGQQEDDNSRHHAEMLNLINQVLQDRIIRIDQQLEKFGATDEFANPLYIAPGLGTSDESRPLAEDYRGIARKLIHQTHRKATEARHLKAALADIQRTMGQEHIFFQTLVGENDTIPPENKRNITVKSSEIVTGFINSLKILESDLDRIISLADGLDFEKSDKIIGSRASASKAFQLNREIEKFILSTGDLDQISLIVDIQLYALLSGMDTGHAEQLKSYEMLEKTSLARDKAVEKFSQALANIEEITDTDAILARDLKKVGRDIISQGQAFFKSKTSILSDLLAQNASAADSPYFDFLTGVNQQLAGRLGVIESMVSLANELKIQPTEENPCPECVPAEMVWPELAELGAAYTNTLKQLDDLADIESFYSSDNLSAGSLLTDARNMFSLSKRLGNQPFLYLNPDSIDVVFRADRQMVVIKGIGDPKRINFTPATIDMGMDYLMQAPYIGDPGKRIVNDLIGVPVKTLPIPNKREIFFDFPIFQYEIKPISEAVYSTASSVITTATELGGKIATVGGEIAQTVYESAKHAVDAAEIGIHYFSEAMDMFVESSIWLAKFGGDVFKNTFKNMFFDEDGSFGWLKTLGYALEGIACAASLTGVVAGSTTVILAGAAAAVASLACKKLLISIGVDGFKGVIDTASAREWISKKLAALAKIFADVAEVFAKGIYNLKGISAKAWEGMGYMERWLAFLGIAPKDLKEIITKFSKVEWSKIEKFLMMAGKMAEAASKWHNIWDYYDKISDWKHWLKAFDYDKYDKRGRILPYPYVGILPYPYDGGAGTPLPNSNKWCESGSSPGVAIGAVPPGPSWTMPSTTSTTFVNPYADWKNPYADWKNPYADWVNPYAGYVSPY